MNIWQNARVLQKPIAIVLSFGFSTVLFLLLYSSLNFSTPAYALEADLPVKTVAQQSSSIRYATPTGDSGTGNNCTNSSSPCSLQRAVNAAAAGDEVRAAGGVYDTAVTVNGKTAVVVINKNITLNGGYSSGDWSLDPANNETILDGQDSNQVVYLNNNSESTLNDLTIRNGYAQDGAGIQLVSGTALTVENSVIRDNVAFSSGGGILIEGSVLKVINSQIYSNVATYDGGGIYSWGGISGENGGFISVENSLIANNTSGEEGGGIYSDDGSVFIDKSSLIHNNNEAIYINFQDNDFVGDDLVVNDFLTLTNSTVSQNDYGIISDKSQSEINIYNSTIISNTLTGVSFGEEGAIENTIIGGHNMDCYVPAGSQVVSNGHNLINDDGGLCVSRNVLVLGDLTNTNPLVSDLTSSYVHQLLENSPAIDAGENSTCPSIDQLGSSRPADGNGDSQAVCDIGAFEYIPSTIEAVSGLNVVSDKQTVAVAESTNFTATINTGEDVTYDWDFADGVTLQEQTGVTSHAYSQAGVYTVTTTASNNVSSQSDTTTISVYELITSVSIIASGNMTVGNSITFEATNDGTDVMYAWDFGDGSDILYTNQMTVNHTYTAPSSYEVTVTAANPLSTKIATTPITIASLPGPDVAIEKTAPELVEVNETFSYTLTVANQGGSPATNVVITDTLPSGVAVQDTDGTYDSGANIVTWSLSSLAASTQQSFYVEVAVTAAAETELVNTATITADSDSYSLNNSTSHTATVAAALPRLTTSTSATDFYLLPDQTETLTFTIANNGTTAANNLNILNPYDWVTTTTSFPTTLNQNTTLEAVYTINTTGVPEGRYEADMDVEADNAATQSVPVTFFVGDFVSDVTIDVTNTASNAVSNARITLVRAAPRAVYNNNVQAADETLTYQAVTYFDGQVTIPYLPLGTYTLTVSADQHETYEVSIPVTSQTDYLPVTLTAFPTLAFEPAMANVAVLVGESDYIQVNVRNLGPGIASGFSLDSVTLGQSWMTAGLPPNAQSIELLPGEALPVTVFLNPPASLSPATFTGNQIEVSATGISPATLDLTVDVVNVATGTLAINVLDETTFNTTVPLEEAKVTLINQTPRTIQTANGSSYQVTDWQTVETDSNGAVTVGDLPAGEYNLYVENEGYYNYADTVNVSPGSVNSSLGINTETISLERDPFSFAWSVTEGTITDTYDITITVTTEEGQQLFPALFVPPEKIEFEPAQGASNVSPAVITGGGALKVAQAVTDSGEWLIVNMGWFPITNLELEPQFGDLSFAFDANNIPATLEPGEAFTMPFTVSFSGADIETQPCGGQLNVSGSYQIPYLGWEWDIYRTDGLIYRDCPGQEGSWSWSYNGNRVTGKSAGGYPARPPNAPAAPNKEGAQLILSGSAFLTRQALWADLTLNANQNLTGVFVDIGVNNKDGESLVGGFAVTPTLPTTLNGNGQIATGESVSQKWLLVPGDLGVTDPSGEPFTIRGYISYDQGATVQTTAETVRIYPQPRIELKYNFNQPDEQNRFFIEVEAVNNGHGPANNLKLDLSDVTVLTDLDGNGTHITYQLLETTIDGEAVDSEGYTFDFGTMAPGTAKTGRWQIEIQAAGGGSLPFRMLVTEFSVACQHRDYQGLTLSPLIVNCGGQPQTYYTTDCPFCTLTGREVHVAGPINTYSGNHDFSQSTPSISTVGAPLNVMWTYNSLSTGVPASPVDPYTSTLGLGWTHNHNMVLVPDETIGAQGGVVIYAPKGTPMEFEETALGYQTAPGIHATLVRIPAGQPDTYTYTLTAHEQSVFVFNNDGQLVTRTDPQGNVTDYTYTSGLLTRVEDRITGRGFDFTYDPNGRLQTVTDSINRVTTFHYQNGLLSNVVDPRQETWVYEYVTVAGVSLLDRVLDPDGHVIEDTDHDSTGRATAQTYRGQQWTIQYVDDYRRVVTQGSGAEATSTLLVYSGQGLIVGTADYVEGELQELATLSHDSNENLTYGKDKNGNVTSGNRTAAGYPTSMVNALDDVTLYGYDGRNNLTTFTDALSRTTTYEYDAQNNLITSTNAMDGEVVYTYNDYGQVTSETDENERTTSYQYDQWGQLVVMTDTNNLVTSYGYDGVGRLITTTNPFGKVTVNEYDPMNNLIQVTNNVWVGQPQNYLDEYNIVTEYGYDSAGYRTVVTDTMGRVNLTFYDPAGRVYLTVNNYDTVTTYGSNPAQELCGFPTPVNPSTEFNLCSLTEYDSAGRVVATTDNIGRVNRTFYDAQGRVAGTVNNSVVVDTMAELATCYQLPEMRDSDSCTTYAYDAMGNTLVTTDTVGNMTYTVYDQLNRSVATIRNWDGTDPQWLLDNYATLSDERTENLISQTAYDAVGNTLVTTDTVGRMTYNVYDGLNRLQGTIQNWDGVTDPQTIIDTCTTLDPMREYNLCSVYTYNASGQQLTSTNGLGQVTRNVYEPSGRLLTTIQNWDGTDPNTLMTQFNNGLLDPEREVNLFTLTEYDPVTGQRTASIDALGQRTEYGYDSLGRLITTTRYIDDRPIETVSVYNALSNVTQRIDAEGHVMTTTYDTLNRVVNTISAEGVVVTTTYDALGRSVGTIDNLGHTTSTVYDGMGRVITSTNAEGEFTVQTYNIEGERLVQTDAEGVQTAYVYDDLGRQTHMIQDWDGTDVAQLVAAPVVIEPTTTVNLITRYTYDLQGNQLSVVNARGYTATYKTYDSLNRVVTVQNALITSTQTTAYNVLGQTVVMTDANGAETHYSYDGLNRVETIFYAADNETVTYGYDVRGQKTVMTDSVGTTVYEYDDLNRLFKVTDPFTATVEYLYNDNGQRSQIVYPDGKVVTYTYDADNRLETVTDWSLGLFTYEYDAAGRHITTTLSNGVVSVNGYDKANRLVSRTYTAADDTLLGQYEYELDKVGHKITVTETVLAPDVVEEIETFLEENGQLVLEAEAGQVNAGASHSWENQTVQSDSVGDGYLRALPDLGDLFGAGDADAPTVSYRFQIDNPNDYALWLRGSAADAGSDSVHVSVEGQGASTALTGFTREWAWASQGMDSETNTPVTLDLNSAGVYTLNLTMREDGVRLDRLLLITDTNTIPTGDGPPVSVSQLVTETTASGSISQVVTYAYDDLYRLQEAVYEGTLNATYSYDHDAMGNRVAYTQTVQNSGTASTTVTTYQYDAADYLRVSVEDGITTSYQWDNAGRLITTTVNGVVSRVYAYSQDGDLMQATVNGLVTTFAYNGVGQRLSLTVAGETTYYVLDYGSRINRVLYEYNSQGSKHYLYGGACLAEFVTDTQTEETEWRHYLYDGNGYVRQTVDEQAEPTYAWTFSPEGSVLLGEEGPVTHLTCVGDAVYDWSTGLIFKNGNYYDPTTDTWVSLSAPTLFWLFKRPWRSRRERRGDKKYKPSSKFYLWLLLLLMLTLLLAGCTNPEPTPTPQSVTATPTSTPCPPTEIPPTNTPVPTNTNTPVPTNTPLPPQPTNTNTPTVTPSPESLVINLEPDTNLLTQNPYYHQDLIQNTLVVNYSQDYNYVTTPSAPTGDVYISYSAPRLDLRDAPPRDDRPYFPRSVWNGVSDLDLYTRIVSAERASGLPTKRDLALEGIAIAYVFHNRTLDSYYGNRGGYREQILSGGQFAFTLVDENQDSLSASRRWAGLYSPQLVDIYEESLIYVIGVTNGWFYDTSHGALEFRGNGVENFSSFTSAPIEGRTREDWYNPYLNQ